MKTRTWESPKGELIFQDRADAGLKLANELRGYANERDAIVLGIPRGGVSVAYEVASALGLPLDVFVVRKLGVPGHEELAFGAIASGGVRFLDREIMELAGVTAPDIERITQREKRELDRRERLYRGHRPPLQLMGKTVILVDDGIATGASTQAAIAALRQLNAGWIVVAAPVGAAATCKRLRAAVESLVCLDEPKSFYAIGQFYEDFRQVADEEVARLLRLNAEEQIREAPPERLSGGGVFDAKLGVE